jgi:hypothetical protein
LLQSVYYSQRREAGGGAAGQGLVAAARQRRDSWFPGMDSAEERRRKELVWLVGYHQNGLRLQSPSAYQHAGEWELANCIHTGLLAYKSGSSVRSLAVDQVRH